MEGESRLELVQIQQEEVLNRTNELLVEDVAESTNFSENPASPPSLQGQARQTLEEIYKIYCDYGRQLGFSVRKSTSRSTKDQKVYERYFLCSCEGHKRVKKMLETDVQQPESEVKPKRKKKTKYVRIGCNASIRVKLNGDGLYEIVSHVTAHNHELTKTEHKHYLRSERSITMEKEEVKKTMTNAGITPIDSYNYLCQDAGGEEVPGHTLKDHYNYVTQMRMLEIEGGDAQTLIDILTQRSVEDGDFFYRVRLDDSSRLSHIFWRDSRMKEDYGCFGDVMVFDTTYRTNRYNLICAPFVGINYHWKNVMFGCAFLSDEKEETFVWLFETFKKSMQGKDPDSIFTDQDQAMINVVVKVFPDSRHRLCIWHIHKNTMSHFGRLKRDPKFQDVFNKCLKNCGTEDEFYGTWNQMIKKYDLQEESWFKRLYDIREKWCTALNKDYFSAGILSSQRSESTNHALGFRVSKTTSLTEFYKIFEKTVKRWRSREIEDEYSSRRMFPNPKEHINGLVKHAMEIYTVELFDDFKSEFEKAMSSIATFKERVESTVIYDVALDEGNTNKHTVCYTKEDNFFTCTCKRFEEMKMLCYHTIRIMHMHSLLKIPRENIAERWCKTARDNMWNEMELTEGAYKKNSSSIPWRHKMAKKYYNLLLKCEDIDEAREMMEKGLERDLEECKRLVPEPTQQTNDSESASVSASASSNANLVLDPDRSKTKGRRKRIKGHFEMRTTNTAGGTTSSSANREFGSATPNPRII